MPENTETLMEEIILEEEGGLSRGKVIGLAAVATAAVAGGIAFLKKKGWKLKRKSLLVKEEPEDSEDEETPEEE